MKDVESRDAIEFLLLIVQTDDGAGALGMLRADGAEIHDEGNTGVGNSGGVGIGDAVLVGAQIRMAEIFGEDEVDGGSASEGFGDGVGIFDVSDKGLVRRDRREERASLGRGQRREPFRLWRATIWVATRPVRPVAPVMTIMVASCGRGAVG